MSDAGYKNTPFIVVLYEDNGKREVFGCDFPSEFEAKFENRSPEEITIGFFFVAGQEASSIKTLDDAFKFCKA